MGTSAERNETCRRVWKWEKQWSLHNGRRGNSCWILEKQYSGTYFSYMMKRRRLKKCCGYPPVRFLAGEGCVQRSTPFACSSSHPCKPLSCTVQDATSTQTRHARIHSCRHGCTLRDDTQDKPFLSSGIGVGHGGGLSLPDVQRGSQSSRGSGYGCTDGP